MNFMLVPPPDKVDDTKILELPLFNLLFYSMPSLL